MTTAAAARPYAQAAEVYFDAGWSPLPISGKFPPPSGWTGRDAPRPSWPDVTTWIADQGEKNLGLRLPPNVLGIDVDQYDGKHGGATLAECEQAWAPLPATWRSTARTDGLSGIRLFRVPEGMSWPGELPGGDVETIHASHRYVMCWPSVHPGTGLTYRWWGPDGQVSLTPPTPAELPMLPWQWLAALNRPAAASTDKAVDPAGWGSFVNELAGVHDEPCRAMKAGQDRVVQGLSSGSRHEALLDVVALVRLGEQGHAGTVPALASVRSAFLASVLADGSRTETTAFGEFDRAMVGAVALVRASPTWPPAKGDPCQAVGAVQAPAPPAQVATPVPNPVAAPAQPGTGVPTNTWSPRVDLDEALAGTRSEEPPTQLTRLDGQPLLYPGRVNGIIGPSESGKSWIAFEAIRQAMAAGSVAWLLDFEDTLIGAVERLRTLGVSDEMMRARFLYSDPSQMFDPPTRALVEAVLANRHPALVVVDGFNAAMAVMRLDLMSNGDATVFHQEVLQPLTTTGAAVAYVDHTPKNDREMESAGGIGAQAKRAMTTGCTLRVEVITAFGRGDDGVLKLWIDKDRPGYVRGNSAGKLAAHVTVQSGDPMLIVLAGPPKEEGPFRPTELMERVIEYLALENAPTSKRKIMAEVRGRAEYVAVALDTLVAEGTVARTKKGASWLHELATDPDRFPLPNRFLAIPGSRQSVAVSPFPSPEGREAGTGHSGPGEQSTQIPLPDPDDDPGDLDP